MKNLKTAIISVMAVLFVTAAVILIFDPFHMKNENKPYDPGTPEPAAHEGAFVSEHGMMVFHGDGKTVVINFDETLAELTGLPEGSHLATYRFLSGDLPPHGSVEVRYDTAHELEITTDEAVAVIQLGLASQDGSSAQAGAGMVTEKLIPLLLADGERWFTVSFEKAE